MASNFLKNLESDDIFISYSRVDGSAYLTGLDAALSARGFSCFTDKRGTDADRLPPKTLFRKIRLCKTLVLLGTPGAVESPENITPELKEFTEANGTARIVCVSFDRGGSFAAFPQEWDAYVVGKSREREAAAALTSGEPSPAVVETIATASNYMKSKDRLRKYRNRAIWVLAILVVSIIAAAVFAGLMIRRAAAETAKAAQATRDAEQALTEARAARQEAQTARAEAATQTAEAERQKGEAERQKGLADRATEKAEAQTRVARQAERDAREAAARAAAEGTRQEGQTFAQGRVGLDRVDGVRDRLLDGGDGESDAAL
ncbi:MAG TPA: TIR domain-containing protein [Pyrinomonadaceae bacterium]|nr:TIR domain-containing protein [Pyrinomonadaceae bacterium]